MKVTLNSYKSELFEHLHEARVRLKETKQSILDSERAYKKAKEEGVNRMKAALLKRKDKEANHLSGLEVAWNLLNDNQHTNPKRADEWTPATNMKLPQGVTCWDV